MVGRVFVLLLALLVSACGNGTRTVPSGDAGISAAVECAPYAREVSGIQLYGQAASWWDQAEGQYARGTDPVPRGVLVFRPSSRLPSGHVAVVSEVVSSREIRVTQANWVHHRITGGEPVLDVSAENDWSAVRVWWAPSGAIGASTYPTYGFIAPAGAPAGDRVAAR